jgi:hypothetical protein
MSRNLLACLALCCALVAQVSFAAPILTVSPGPLSGGNRPWYVDITPDAGLLPGSMAVELAFAVDVAELLDVDVNTAAWDLENPGNNPFTGTVTDGLWLDLIGDRTFGAFGSVVFNTPGPVRLFTIETSAELDAAIRFGTAASGSATLGARIAQGGQNFDGYTGTAVVPEPATALLAVVCAAAIGLVRRRK